jgi:hypothetical protein
MVNMAKLVIFFGAICDDQLTEEMKMSTWIQTKVLCEKHLGLSTAVGCSTKEAFEHIPSTYECYKIERLCSRRPQASKSRTSEEHKNISPMHECYFSLNRKCGNTHFTLIEERSIHRDTNLSLYFNLPRRDLSFEGKLSSLGEMVCL